MRNNYGNTPRGTGTGKGTRGRGSKAAAPRKAYRVTPPTEAQLVDWYVHCSMRMCGAAFTAAGNTYTQTLRQCK